MKTSEVQGYGTIGIVVTLRDHFESRMQSLSIASKCVDWSKVFAADSDRECMLDECDVESVCGRAIMRVCAAADALIEQMATIDDEDADVPAAPEYASLVDLEQIARGVRGHCWVIYFG